MSGKKKQTTILSQEYLNHWTKENWELINKMPNTQVKDNQMLKLLKDRLDMYIINFKLDEGVVQAILSARTNTLISSIDIFTDWLIKNPKNISNILCPFYTLHFLHRNIGMDWSKSDIDDLTHLAALPYVDYITVDTRTFCFSECALKFMNKRHSIDWKGGLIKSVKDIGSSPLTRAL